MVVYGVCSFLDSIILNLITNAIKYLNPEKSGKLEITNEMQSGYVVLNFKVNGLGVYLEKYGGEIFGMNKTYHGNKDSRGIGLFINKNQIELLGGKIEVESQVGQETLFSVFLKGYSPSCSFIRLKQIIFAPETETIELK
jgi:sensor histidine kinase regulating citrate/malate metabolism